MLTRSWLIMNFFIAVVATGAADVLLFLKRKETGCAESDNEKEQVFHIESVY